MTLHTGLGSPAHAGYVTSVPYSRTSRRRAEGLSEAETGMICLFAPLSALRLPKPGFPMFWWTQVGNFFSMDF